jgi:hypothetical protein
MNTGVMAVGPVPNPGTGAPNPGLPKKVEVLQNLVEEYRVDIHLHIVLCKDLEYYHRYIHTEMVGMEKDILEVLHMDS